MGNVPLKFIQRKPCGFNCTNGGTEAERESPKGPRKEVCMADTDFSAESWERATTAGLSFLQLKGDCAALQHLVQPQPS